MFRTDTNRTCFEFFVQVAHRRKQNPDKVTYGPHKAVAEVSNHSEPIGKKSGIQLVRKIRNSMDFTFNCFVLN